MGLAQGQEQVAEDAAGRGTRASHARGTAVEGTLASGGGPVPLLFGPDNTTPLKPVGLLAALKRIDDRLDVRWIPEREQWAVVETWRPTDKRWPLYRKGEIGAPFDLFEFLPRHVDPDTLGDWMAAKLGRADLSKPENRHRLRRIRQMQAHNQRTAEKARERAQEPVVEEVKYQTRRILNQPGEIAREEGVSVVYRDRRSRG